MVEPIRKLDVVPCDPDTAFKIFAEQTTNWWPREHHSLSAGRFGKPAKAVTIEPKVGGRVYAGSEDELVRVYDLNIVGREPVEEIEEELPQ